MAFVTTEMQQFRGSPRQAAMSLDHARNRLARGIDGYAWSADASPLSTNSSGSSQQDGVAVKFKKLSLAFSEGSDVNRPFPRPSSAMKARARPAR
jgi:hypothetical protein